MQRAKRVLVAAALGLFVTGCAHAPSSSSGEAADLEGPTRRVITGSRIPQRVDPRTGVPPTVSPVTIYTREDLRATGQPDLRAALLRLDLAANPGR